MNPISPVHAVTFDVGGTLIEPWPTVGHVYAEVAARHGVWPVDVDELNRRFDAAWRAKGEFAYTQKAWCTLVRETFGELAPKLPAKFFDDVYQRFAEPDAWRLCMDVMPALDSLATRGVRLGIISNWDERLEPLLHKLRLASFFEITVVSCDIGFTKPSPVIFEHALRKLGLPGDHVLHVGDGEREDAKGAREAGFQALLLDRSRSSAAAKGRIASLKELERIVAV